VIGAATPPVPPPSGEGGREAVEGASAATAPAGPPKTRAIQITFREPVDLAARHQQALVEIAGAICRDYEAANPGRVAWAFGVGSQLVSMPMTAEDDEAGVPMVFDESVFEIECSEREDYRWPCALCGLEQGDHAHCITQPPAGPCTFQPAPAPQKDAAP
jgi:hypothetical protein